MVETVGPVAPFGDAGGAGGVVSGFGLKTKNAMPVGVF